MKPPAPSAMRSFADLAPWSYQSLGASPFDGMWVFNPSVVRTPDGRWLCALRCANYHLPGSTAQAPREVGPIRNKILLLELAPSEDFTEWTTTRAVEVRIGKCCDVRTWNAALAFEDLRLVWTNGALHATASAMNIEHGVLDIVLLTIDEAAGEIVDARPLRGPWSSQHQKNWSPFADATPFRALYSPLAGGVHDKDARVQPTHVPISMARVAAPSPLNRQFQAGAMTVHIRSGVAPRPAIHRLALRGGTQLVEHAPGRWLGLAHGCEVGALKYYWHAAFEVDFDGELLGVSDPFKLSPEHGIEFAAGLAIAGDGERERKLVVTFGLDDDNANIGTTSLDAVLDLLDPIERQP